MKRVLSIQDISCLGKCSTTIALPLLSAMGLETVILPTALLSAHTMFAGYTYTDLTDQILPIVEHWKSQDLTFDAIYTGYLGSAREIDLVSKIIEMFKTDDTLVFIDPVMADHGLLYPGFESSYIDKNAQFCARGDIIVPNLTEAALMTGVPYKERYEQEEVEEILRKLTLLGTRVVVLTGVGLQEGMTGFYGLDTETGQFFSYQTEWIGGSYHGTGDIFSSTAVGALVRGYSLEKAFRLAADYTAKTVQATLQDPDKPWYSVNFETTIPWLVDRLREEK